MVHLEERKELFIQGLIDSAGWTRQHAEEHFTEHAPKWEIGNSIDFAVSEAVRLRKTYPKITAAPMHYKVENNRIYLIKE
jgi:carbonic anhydrase